MQTTIADPLAPPPRHRWRTIAVLLVIAVVVVLALILARETPDLVVDRTPVAAPDGAPAADVYVVLETHEVDEAELRNLYLDLGPGESYRPGSIRHLARAMSTLGTTDLVDWTQTRTTPDGQTVVEQCQGQMSNYGTSGSGSAGCGPVDELPPGPLLSRGATVGDDESFARVTVSETGPAAAWLLVTTQQDNSIVANVLNATSYVEWVSSDRGDIKRIALLDAAFAEIWVDDSF